MSRRRIEILVDGIKADDANGRSRVEAEVLGTTIWFESSEICLRPRAEVFACALLIPALHAGARLRFHRPIDPVWRENSQTLMRVLKEWWRYPELPPTGPTEPPIITSNQKRTALCFSGGVDSFYTLLRSGEEIDDLVTIFGFDMEVDDTTRTAAVEESVREIAARMGIRPIFVRTNLRDHPLVGRVSWERSHGGAIAAIGFLMSAEISRLLISSSIDRGENQPWGTHWELDPRWSSADLNVVNYGNHLRRVDKLTAISAEPLLRNHLRVCWENRRPSGNCSRCQKCLNTRLVLADCGVLDHYAVFQNSETLITDLREMPTSEGRLQALHEVVARRRLSADIIDEVKALIARSAPVPKRHRDFLPIGWDKVRGWMQRIYQGR
jgi:hypothetical protein